MDDLNMLSNIGDYETLAGEGRANEESMLDTIFSGVTMANNRGVQL